MGWTEAVLTPRVRVPGHHHPDGPERVASPLGHVHLRMSPLRALSPQITPSTSSPCTVVLVFTGGNDADESVTQGRKWSEDKVCSPVRLHRPMACFGSFPRLAPCFSLATFFTPRYLTLKIPFRSKISLCRNANPGQLVKHGSALEDLWRWDVTPKYANLNTTKVPFDARWPGYSCSFASLRNLTCER